MANGKKCTRCDRLGSRLVAEGIRAVMAEDYGDTVVLSAPNTFSDGSYVLIVGPQALEALMNGEMAEGIARSVEKAEFLRSLN